VRGGTRQVQQPDDVWATITCHQRMDLNAYKAGRVQEGAGCSPLAAGVWLGKPLAQPHGTHPG
jgi:hypothetical protein